MTFEEFDLDYDLLNTLTNLNFIKPTSIQQESIPKLMDGHDILASAPTGTGKTLAYLVPAIQHLLDYPNKIANSGRVLILTPTRELAMQIEDQAKQICEPLNLKSINITGGVNYAEHGKKLSKAVDIVIATVGRLIEYINADIFDCEGIEYLIIDEADRMLDMGFINDIKTIIEKTTRREQTALFSATLEGNNLVSFAKNVMKDPISIETNPSRKEKPKILQYIHYADSYEHKLELLKYYLSNLAKNNIERTIIFVKTRERLFKLVQELQASNISVIYLRGEMEQHKRNNALEKFRNGEVNILIATDVASRGLDIPQISHVFNFDLPRSADVYVHRIGRTGRAGKKGCAISIIEAHDIKMVNKIENYIQEKLKKRTIEHLKPKHKITNKVTKKKKQKKTSTDKKLAKKLAKGKEKKLQKRNKQR